MTSVTSSENIVRPPSGLELGGEGGGYLDVDGIKSREIGNVTSEPSIVFV
jgi:hypothetical protein